MADNIEARILIAVEYGDALKNCDKVEKGLEDITEARKKDLEVAREAQKATADSTTFIDKETEAIKRRNKAKSETPYEQPQPQSIDWERIKRERAEAQKAMREMEREAANPNAEENAAAQKAMKKRIKLEKQAQEVIDARRHSSQKTLAQEKASADMVTAEYREQLAVIKEIQAQNQLLSSRIKLTKAEKRGDSPQRIKELSDEVDKNNAAWIKAQQESANASSAVRKAHEALGGSSKEAAAKMQSFGRASTGVIRMLKTAARIGGKGLGVDVTTEGMTGADKTAATLGAAGAALAGVVALFRSAIATYQEVRRDEYKRVENEINYRREVVDRLNDEIAARKQGLQTLESYQNKEQLTAIERYNQDKILQKLNMSMRGFNVEIDSASGRIKNFGQFSEATFQDSTRQELANLEGLYRQMSADYKRQTDFLSGAGFFREAFDKEGIVMAQDAVERLTPEMMKVQKRIAELTQALKKPATQERDKERTAKAQTRIDQIDAEIKKIQSRTSARKGQDSAIPDKAADEKRLKELEAQKKQIVLQKIASEFDAKRAKKVASEKERIKQIDTEIAKINASDEAKQAAKADAELAKLKKRRQELDKVQAVGFGPSGVAVANAIASQKVQLDTEIKKLEAVPRGYKQQLSKLQTERKGLTESTAAADINSAKNAAMVAAKEKQLKIEKEMAGIQERQYQRDQQKKQIDQELAGLNHKLKIQALVNQGREREAQLAELQYEADLKQKKQGWSSEQAKTYVSRSMALWDSQRAGQGAGGIDMRSMAKDINQFRATTQNAVMANSTEALRLQSRRFVNDTGSLQLRENKKTNSLLGQLISTVKQGGTSGGARQTYSFVQI